MKSEKQGHFVFYGAMVSEGIIALIWAAAGCSLYEVTGGLNTGLAAALAKGQSAAIFGGMDGTIVRPLVLEQELLRFLTQPQFLKAGHVQHQLSDAGAPQIKCPLTVVQQSQFIKEGGFSQKLQQIRVPPLADEVGEAGQRL